MNIYNVNKENKKGKGKRTKHNTKNNTAENRKGKQVYLRNVTKSNTDAPCFNSSKRKHKRVTFPLMLPVSFQSS